MTLLIYSWVSNESDSSSIMATAMFEQWSDTRSQLVSRSLNAKPWLSVHSPVCRRSMWCSFISSQRLSMSSSSGSTR